MTRVFALVGYPLTHSFSPGYFNERFRREQIDAVYKTAPLQDISLFLDWLADNPNVCGLNVTIPYKSTIIPYLDQIDPIAAAIGAVNCITVKNGKTKGYNTDIIGFGESLKPMLASSNIKALVLGTGGASKAVTWVLNRFGIPYRLVSRKWASELLTYDMVNAHVLGEYRLIINTTPLGMYPSEQHAPELPYNALTDKHLLFDLIYNPPETTFLKYGRRAGATVKNGLEMLYFQADTGWEMWNHPTFQPTV